MTTETTVPEDTSETDYRAGRCSDVKTTRIREHNDELRTSLLSSRTRGFGDVVITSGLAEMGGDFVRRAMERVTTFTAFTVDNDPHCEHDFGSFTLDADTVFWKIDYYAAQSQYRRGSEDPADAKATERVLTVMLAQEY